MALHTDALILDLGLQDHGRINICCSLGYVIPAALGNSYTHFGIPRSSQHCFPAISLLPSLRSSRRWESLSSLRLPKHILNAYWGSDPKLGPGDPR